MCFELLLTSRTGLNAGCLAQEGVDGVHHLPRVPPLDYVVQARLPVSRSERTLGETGRGTVPALQRRPDAKGAELHDNEGWSVRKQKSVHIATMRCQCGKRGWMYNGLRAISNRHGLNVQHTLRLYVLRCAVLIGNIPVGCT